MIPEPTKFKMEGNLKTIKTGTLMVNMTIIRFLVRRCTYLSSTIRYKFHLVCLRYSSS
jgi:hypothetical protein